MAFRRNAAYNDPAIGQAFDNLASMFAPPKATDALAWTKARAEREQADRVAGGYSDLASFFTPEQHAGVRAMGADYLKQYPQFDMYRRAGETNDPASLDSRAYAVFGNAGNTFAGRREAEAAATGRTQSEQSGALAREFAKPIILSEGQTAVLPDQTAAATGLSRMFMGGVKLGQGQTFTPPQQTGVGTISGPEKPLTETEAKGKAFSDLRADNAFSMDELKAVVFGNTPLQSISTANGPRLVTGPQAIGQQPQPEPGKMSELAILQNERDAIARQNPSDPRIGEYRQRIEALGRGQQQSAWDKGNDESFVKLNEGIYTNAQSASSNLGTLDYIQQLVEQSGGDQGKWANARLEIRKGLQALGINAGDTSPLEVQRALAARFALQLRDPSQGAGMPGAMSDADRQFLASMTPGIENSPDASRKIIDIYRRLNRRTMDIENMRREYIQRNGRIDEGFRNQVSDFVNSSPLFAETAARPGAAPMPAGAPAAHARATSSPPASSGYPEGMQIENDAGERMIRRNGRWEPL